MPPTDEDLMLAYAAGDAAAFETLYGRHKGPLYRFVLRSVKTAALAEELFQEIWIKAIEARSRYTPSAKFTTWLYTIAHHRLVDHWRTKGLAVVSLDEEESAVAEPAAGPQSEPDRQLEGKQALERFSAALAALPMVQREAFLMHQEAEMSVAEIAAASGTNEEAAKSRLRYAMNKLREAMQ
jgi:RNA polymerase sigma-70 factor (ECF subfamily)